MQHESIKLVSLSLHFSSRRQLTFPTDSADCVCTIFSSHSPSILAFILSSVGMRVCNHRAAVRISVLQRLNRKEIRGYMHFRNSVASSAPEYA